MFPEHTGRVPDAKPMPLPDVQDMLQKSIGGEASKVFAGLKTWQRSFDAVLSQREAAQGRSSVSQSAAGGKGQTWNSSLPWIAQVPDNSWLERCKESNGTSKN
jgi:hypothetical protein